MTSIRILYREPDGSVVDGQLEFGTETFAGQVPAVGDIIVDPGVLQGQSRYEPQNRRILAVVGRVFNPHDREDVVGLIVESRDGNSADEAYI